MTSLIYKYLNNQASEKEVALLFEWIEASEEHKQEFIALKKIALINPKSNKPNIYQWNKIKAQLHKSPQKRPLKYLNYAVGFLCILYFFIFSPFEKAPAPASLDNQITLQTHTGKKEVLLENSTKRIENSTGGLVAKQNDKEIVYYKQKETPKIAYNTITVPYSKTFKVSLSDGSVIYLNAGSSLTYPEQFKPNSNRVVVLEGEAMFEVAKDPNSPFIVQANQVDIEVLGTTFNVSSYLEDGFTSCVLVEGAVRLSAKDHPENSLVLTPNEKSVWQFSEKTFSKELVNTKYYTSWVNGELVFRNTPFAVISKKIERYYDVKFINNNTFLAKQTFTGTIKIKESKVEDILELFKIDTKFEYQRRNNTFQILKP